MIASQDLEGDRRAGYRYSGRRTDIAEKVRYLARTPAGDQSAAYMESPGFPRALSMFSRSHDEFDLWF
jgi:hypothetical protein